MAFTVTKNVSKSLSQPLVVWVTKYVRCPGELTSTGSGMLPGAGVLAVMYHFRLVPDTDAVTDCPGTPWQYGGGVAVGLGDFSVTVTTTGRRGPSQPLTV